MRKAMNMLRGPLGWLTAGVLLLTFSRRARSGTRNAVLKGSETVMGLGDQVKGSVTKRKNGNATQMRSENDQDKQQVKYPDYVGSSFGGVQNSKASKTTNVRRVNPSRFNKSKNVMNDEVMPSKMAEIAEEFELFDKD
ncbi:hypothetical protein ABFG93_13675 [Pseudalkalibacillus hwajinpoensis]|uniref:hypothetical protein n=1 Tax=Guptibacillus hwajinpoensis TaxID=208199 RepID=UPI00325BBB19